MDQHTLDVEDTANAGHPAGTSRPSDAALLRDTGLPADAALLSDTVRPTNAALPTDAASPAVNIRDREAAWPPALNFCSRHPRLYGLVALVLLLLIACVPIFTRTEPWPALTITASPNQGTRENNADQVTPVSHIGCPNTTQQVRLISSLGDPFLPSGSIAASIGREQHFLPTPAPPRPAPLLLLSLNHPLSISHSEEIPLRLDLLNDPMKPGGGLPRVHRSSLQSHLGPRGSLSPSKVGRPSVCWAI